MIRLAQINLQKMKMARSLLANEARTREVDLLVISEQPSGPPDNDRCWSSTDHLAQVVLTERAKLVAVNTFKGRGFVGVDTGRLVVVSCYLPPSLSPDQYATVLGDLENACASYQRADILVCGDFNAKVDVWGSGRTDAKGLILQEFASDLGLQCENIGLTPTFQSPVGESVVDFTLSRLSGGSRIVNWIVDRTVYTIIILRTKLKLEMGTGRYPTHSRMVDGSSRN